MPMPIILLDTNLLLLPFSRKFNLTEQLATACPQGKPHVPSCVLAELERMDHPDAKAARQLAATFPTYDTETAEGDVDSLLASLASQVDGLIATNDRELIGTLKGKGLPVLRLKGNDRLVLDGTLG